MVDMGRVKMGMGMKRVVAMGVKDEETEEFEEKYEGS